MVISALSQCGAHIKAELPLYIIKQWVENKEKRPSATGDVDLTVLHSCNPHSDKSTGVLTLIKKSDTLSSHCVYILA